MAEFDNDTLARDSGADKYGARMGRRDVTDNEAALVNLFRVRMSPCGAYDAGGAYWGIGHDPLYCAWGDRFRVFRRAEDRAAAKAMLAVEFPHLRFIR